MAKRIGSLILAALALVCLVWCGVNAVSAIKEYNYLNSIDAGGADYLGIVVQFYLQCGVALLGCILSAVAFFIADRKWIKVTAAVLFVLLVVSVIIMIAVR